MYQHYGTSMSASSVTDIPARCLVLLLFAVLVALPTSSYGLLRGHYSFYADVEVRRRGTATMSAKIWFDYENSRERFELDLWGSGFVTEIFRYNTSMGPIYSQECSLTCEASIVPEGNRLQPPLFVLDEAESHGTTACLHQQGLCEEYRQPLSTTMRMYIYYSVDQNRISAIRIMDIAQNEEQLWIRFLTYTVPTSPFADTLFEPPENCRDIAFVMDGSESIDDTEWSSMTSFAEHVVDGFPATSVNSNIRVGLIRFSSVGVIHLPLTSNRTKIMGAIENFPKGMGLTALGRGLKAAHNMFVSPSSQPNGTRAVIALTDGYWNFPTGDDPVPQANVLKSSLGAKIIVAAVGKTNDGVLNNIASSTNHVYRVDDALQLPLVVSSVLGGICGELSCATADCGVGYCACGACWCPPGYDGEFCEVLPPAEIVPGPPEQNHTVIIPIPGQESESPSAGAIIGILIAVAAVLGLVIGFTAWITRRRQAAAAAAPLPGPVAGAPVHDNALYVPAYQEMSNPLHGIQN